MEVRKVGGVAKGKIEAAAPTLLERMVMAGRHGRKTGKGFYDHAQDPPRPTEVLV